MATNQEALISALQTALGAGYEDYSLEGLWHAYWDGEGIAAGPFNQRLLAWINSYEGTSLEDLPRLMQLYADNQSFYNWSSISTFTLVGGDRPPEPEQDTGDQTSSGVTSDSASFPSNTTSGNAIVVALSIKGTESVDTITDDQSNIYALVGRVLDTDVSTELWVAYDITGGATQITVTYTGAVTGAVWSGLEVSNVRKNSVDYTSYAEATGGGGSSNPVAVTGNTPLASSNLWLASMGVAGGGTNAGIATPSGWTQFNVYQDYTNIVAGEADYKTDTNGDALSASWSNNTTTSNYAAMIVALRNATAPQSTVEGEGEIANIASKSGVSSIFLNTNDTTSMIQGYNVVLAAENEYADSPGDPVAFRVNKAFCQGLTVASYLSTIATNRINNGTFDSATGWNVGAGVTIAGGVATFNGTSNTLWRDLDDATGINEGTGADFCRIQFDVTTYNSGTLQVRTGQTASLYNVPQATGTYVLWATAEFQGQAYFSTSDFDGAIDNVEYKHVPGKHGYITTGTCTCVLDIESGRYGVEWGSLADMNFRPGPSSAELTGLDYWINRSTTLTKGIFVGDNSGDWFDIWEDGVASSILDAGLTIGAVYVDDVEIATPTRDEMHTAIATGAITTTHYENANLFSGGVVPLVVGNGYIGGSFDPGGTVDFGMLFRFTDTVSLKANERRRVSDFYEDLRAIDNTNTHVSTVSIDAIYNEASNPRVTSVSIDVLYTPV